MTTMRKRFKALALSLAEGQADASHDDLIEFLTDVFLDGYPALTEEEVLEFEADDEDIEVE